MGYRDSNGVWHTEDPDESVLSGGQVVNSDTGNNSQFTNTSGLGTFAGSTNLQGPGLLGTEQGGRQHGNSIAYPNFAWGGQRGGAQDDVNLLQQQNAAVQRRGAVQLDTTAADLYRQTAIEDQKRQAQLAEMYQQQLTGRGPSAAQIGGQASLEQALQAQAAQAGQASNQNALAGAQLGAAASGAQGMLQSNGQFASARGQETAAAASGYGKNAQAMRAQDLMQAGMSQEQAYHQAQLEAAERARKDAMAQFYTGQENDIQRQQLSANQQYAALLQDEQNRSYQAVKQRNQQEADKTKSDWATGINIVGTGLTGGAVTNAGGMATGGG